MAIRAQFKGEQAGKGRPKARGGASRRTTNSKLKSLVKKALVAAGQVSFTSVSDYLKSTKSMFAIFTNKIKEGFV